MSTDTRLKLGVALLILGLVMPAGALLVAATDWPVAVKTVVSSILLFGFEIMLIPAVALMGKDNFERIWAGAVRLLKTLKPAGDRELRSVLGAGGLRSAGLGQSGARRRYSRQLVRAGWRFLEQSAGAVSSRRARHRPFLSGAQN